LLPPPYPRFTGERTSSTPGNSFSTATSVPSAEALSTTMIRLSRSSEHRERIESRVSSRAL
jgi:hypothetical protein